MSRLLALGTVLLLALPAPAADVPPPEATAAEERSSQAQGRLFVDRRTEVVGATVRMDSERWPGRIFLTASDGDGVFRIGGLPDGSYRLQIQREGLRPVVKEGVTVRFPFRAVVELPMEPGPAPAPGAIETGAGGSHLLRGRATLGGDEPLAEVELRLLRPDGGLDPRVAISDERGQFEIDGLPGGPWSLTARAVGMLTLREELVVRGDLDLELTMVRQPADYDPSPLDLMPAEEPIVPAGLRAGVTDARD